MIKLIGMLLTVPFMMPAMAEEKEIDVSDAHAKLIFNAATLAGIIRACEEPWEEYYLTFMQIERAKARAAGLPEEQMAKMIGFMFGAAQAQAHRQVEKDPDMENICSSSNLNKVKVDAMQILKEVDKVTQ